MNAQQGELHGVYCPGGRLDNAGRVILLELQLRKWYNKLTLIEGKLIWFGEVVMKPAFRGVCSVSFT